MLFWIFWTFYSSENAEKNHGFHGVISEGSCDTEEQSNGWWKFSFTSQKYYILKYIKMENRYINLVFAKYFIVISN